MYFENEILHPGDKIKKLRIMLHAAQKELSSKNISRNFISAIENKRALLSINAAEVIADNLNRIIDDGAYTLPHITSDELLLSEEEQAIRLAKNKIKELSKHKNASIKQFKLKVNNIENIINSYNIPEDIIYNFFEIVIEFYYDNFYYEMAEVYILKKLDLSSIEQNKIEYIESLLTKMKIYIELNKNSSIVHLGEYILEFMNKNKIDDETYKKRIYFNIALSCKKLNKSKEGLYYINKLRSEFQFTEGQLNDITLLEGNLYRQTGDYKLSEIKMREYLELSIKIKCNRSIVLAYNDLAYHYHLLKDYGRAKFYIDMAIQIISNNSIDNELLAIVFHEAFTIYMKFDEDKMFYYFNKTLDKAFLISNNPIILDAINRIFDYFEARNNKKKNLEILKIVDEKIKNYDKKNELGEIYIRAFNYIDF
ncbi:helix-turn-helix domain protein [Clostridium argentinense CDC 2741]|uniref:Helix-turn-helix domain protein n=1 Tax=Clostridium argentinense CDC 2741 TaxID=1418104 RepID=A0A0C1R9G0_9CLOT|nr:helix-turn-helix transcriptional regulator [Clostridium argentinense]ARC85510.1 transcriptional regulator [Clostridium argentinense]KIE47071.1 helix-turn-helix domain protein [Clostridium argentinense CDC 2741]NFF40023.1 helix-turn-helix transcriptional regulator [Clostridium argentinense]NFP50277.1 helix-turn-helix transcriptional regulator [Clostridium argentinense]NFP71918.1 helix-turn-helix transcriptional regulator [Clostridium argentinense]